ncbi:hypothetical protein GDO81_011131 [Engystomops pustulosus]|uniref:ApaG domain-containing protein n=1 Tax=Engystomops pustulosus TaxID=76066 RepID=A0AAV7BCJ3_ENGPU|nr:hypothetical protein GDO81_011131 [Engystomops pustulosus]
MGGSSSAGSDGSTIAGSLDLGAHARLDTHTTSQVPGGRRTGWGSLIRICNSPLGPANFRVAPLRNCIVPDYIRERWALVGRESWRAFSLRVSNCGGIGTSTSLVNRRFNQLCNHDPLWKWPCRKYWLVSEDKKVQKNRSWKATFTEYYTDLGRYIHHYAKLKAAWDALKTYLGEHCPRMISSLKAGVQEEDLNAIEERINSKLPDDYRCSLRIHNGQKLVVPGLMGSMALSNHYRSEDLLDVDTAAGGYQRRIGLNQCLPITFCIHTGLSQYLSLADVEGRCRNEIFYQCPDQTTHNPAALDMFVTGTSFSQWFTSYVQHVVSGDYPIIRDQIFRYEHDKDCVATTEEITISVSTSFLPELSSIHPPHYFFTYRIR